MTNESKKRRLVIEGNEWSDGPAARVTVKKISPMAPLLFWTLILEEFYRRVKLQKRRTAGMA